MEILHTVPLHTVKLTKGTTVEQLGAFIDGLP